LADQPSTPASAWFHEEKRLPRALGVFAAAVVVGLLVTVCGTFRWGWTWTGYRDTDNASLWGWLHLVLLPVTIALLPLWLRSRERRKAYWRVGFAMLTLALAVLAVGGYRWGWGWTGFRHKTLWNWLEVFLVPFAVPAVLAWATTPPPATPDERLPPEQASRPRPRRAGPAAAAPSAPRAEAAAARPAAGAPADPDPVSGLGVRVARRHLAAPRPARPDHGAAAAGSERADQAAPTRSQAGRAEPLPTAGRPRPPARQPATGAGPGTAGIVPARSAPARLVQAHPALALATSLVLIGLLVGLLGLVALLPGRAPRPAAAAVVTVRVPGNNPGWMNTGVYLAKGERLSIAATGKVDPDGPHPRWSPVGPDGYADKSLRRFSVLPDAPHAALIGQVGGSHGGPFLVGSRYNSGRIDQAGLLELRVNDTGVKENTGTFTARIEVARP
jgi:hypothetical protein